MARPWNAVMLEDAAQGEGRQRGDTLPWPQTEWSRFTTPTGRWLPVTAGEMELKRIGAIPITRYRYCGSKIPNPWVTQPA